MTVGRIILYIWQLPQHLLALAVLIVVSLGGYRPTERERQAIAGINNKYRRMGIWFLYWRYNDGRAMSLGDYIFVSRNIDQNNRDLLHHEMGHTLQSRMLGPLYLLAVGIPSLWNVLLCFLDKTRVYRQHFPENWADRLGARIPEPDSKIT